MSTNSPSGLAAAPVVAPAAAPAPAAVPAPTVRFRAESRMSVASVVTRPAAVSFAGGTPDSHYYPAGFGFGETGQLGLDGQAMTSQPSVGVRYRLRTESAFGMPASPYIPEQLAASRLRLRTESGFGMPVSPYIVPEGGTMPSVMQQQLLHAAAAPFAHPHLAAGSPLMVPPPLAAAPTMVTQAPHTLATGYPGADPQLPVQRIQLTSLVGNPTPAAGSAPPTYMQYPQTLHLHTQLQSPAHTQHQRPLVLTQPPTYKQAHVVSKVMASPGALDGPRTTVMLRNLPDGFTRDALLALLDSQGFAGKYDFAYLPVDFDTLTGLKHAFVNLLTPADAETLREQLEGFTGWEVHSENLCAVAWNDRQQGLNALVERYRNSPVMHESVPDECKPIIIMGGRRAQFPPPTQKIKAPKILKGKGA